MAKQRYVVMPEIQRVNGADVPLDRIVLLTPEEARFDLLLGRIYLDGTQPPPVQPALAVQASDVVSLTRGGLTQRVTMAELASYLGGAGGLSLSLSSLTFQTGVAQGAILAAISAPANWPVVADTTFGGRVAVSGSNLVAAQAISAAATGTIRLKATSPDGLRQLIETFPVAFEVPPDVVAPVITSPVTFTVAENSPYVLQLTASEAVTWSKTGGADAALYTLDAAAATLTLAARDFEAPADEGADNTYAVEITATDAAGNPTSQTIVGTVTNVLEGTPATLIPLTVTILTSAASPEVVLDLPAKVEGEDRSFAPNDGRFVFNTAGKLIRGLTAITAGAVNGTITRTRGGQPLDVNPVTITVAAPLALPALPMAAGARVAAIGDSQIGYNNGFGGAVSTASAAALSTGYGFIEQAAAHDQRFRFDNWYDTTDPRGYNYVGASQGIFGDHLEWAQAGYGGGILGRLPALLARRPDIVIIEGGINTIATGDDGVEGTAEYVIGKLDTALRRARNAGVWSIPMVIYPRGDWVASSDPKMAIVDAVNVWIRAQAGRDGVLGILDAESLLRPGGVFDATMFKTDLIHLSPKGALAVGRGKLLPILQAAISAGSTFDKDPTVSSLLSANQANLAGTAGTQSGWPKTDSTPTQSFSGQLATGLTLTRGRNLSVVASKEVVAGALESQVLAITPGGGESGAYFDFTLSGGFTVAEAHTPGQWYQAYAEVELLGDGLTFLSMTGGHRTAANAVVTNASALLREASGDYALGVAGGARTLWLQTEPFKLPDGAAATDKLAVSITGTGSKAAAAFTMKIRRPILRRIADPRPGWGY